MTNLLQNYPEPDLQTWVPAAADDGMSISQAIFERQELGTMNRAAERSQRLVDNINSRELAVEEAYDRRIKAVREATGIELDNPERHRMTERERRQLRMQGVDEKDIPTYQRKIFDDRLAILQNAHPDKAEKLQFGDIHEEAQAIAKEAEDEYEQVKRTTKLGWGASMLAAFGGGFVGSLRDPLFSGSLLFGPTTAAGKSVAARIFSSAWRQGAYNAGITALEQPAVQAWRAEIGVKSGFTPAIVNVGEAFLFGAIPGAVFRGGHEALAKAFPEGARVAIQRVLDGNPQPGDLEKGLDAANAALAEIWGDMRASSVNHRAIRLGEEIDAADKAVRPPVLKDVWPELHEALSQAALLHAEDARSPSPQAVAAVSAIEAQRVATPDGELRLPAGTVTKEDWGHGLPIRDVDGKEVGHVWFDVDVRSPGTISITGSAIQDEAARGKGYASTAYRDLADFALANGRELWSDTHVVPEAARVYESLKRRGYTVEYNPDPPTNGAMYKVVSGPEAMARSDKPLHPVMQEVRDRITEAQPQSRTEAEQVASEALEDIGTRQTSARMKEELGRPLVGEPRPVIKEPTFPSSTYIKDIAEGAIDLPTTADLAKSLKIVRDTDRAQALAMGMTNKEYERLVQLNREIDRGSDAAMKEKDALLSRFPDDGREPNIVDEDRLKILQTEFKNLEKQDHETLETYVDGISRTLKRYISGVIDGDDLSKAVFRKAFSEAQAHGIDTAKLGNEIINRFLGDLSKSDREFMRKEFADFLRPKIGQQTSARVREELAQPALPEAPEKIVAAAVRTDQGVFRGVTHASAAAVAADKGVDISKLKIDDIDGFLTSTGRFVSREEAAKIADAAEQRTVKEGRLESSNVNYRKGDYDVLTRDEAMKLPADRRPRFADAPYYKVGRTGTESEGQLAGYGTLKEARDAAGLPDIEIAKPPPASSKDPLDKMPTDRYDADGNAKLVSLREYLRQGDRELSILDVIRECK